MCLGPTMKKGAQKCQKWEKGTCDEAYESQNGSYRPKNNFVAQFLGYMRTLIRPCARFKIPLNSPWARKMHQYWDGKLSKGSKESNIILITI